MVTRAAFNSGKVDVVAINDLFINLKYMISLFQYDSIHGMFDGTEQDNTNIKWGDAGVECIVESTGTFTTLKKARIHLKGRAKRVIISASCVCVGHGPEEQLPQDYQQCLLHHLLLGPLVKVTHENFGIMELLMAMVCAIIASQRPWMVPLGSQEAAQKIITLLVL
ncbi:Glyceraldehyde-3-phosphate dehydrogenase [Galemys pyrenaicus]|uniref:Glyceraldehyde-3-phosphate dehydrogenase n=1 Tax=Galemys pyrenaicus TaxID=202257 RepID=A0A8J5ZNF9_GALPY|nr:Glyceraldehyde-3-phosphate dehydrogenase [Galemys pyrenaicus]